MVGTINFGSADGSTKIQGSSSSGTGTVTYTDSGDDNLDNTWTITTVTSKTKSFTQNASYSQVGSSSNAVTSITFTTTLPSSQTIKAFSAKFGGFSGTAGTVTLKVGDTSVGSGSLDATNDVTVKATNTTTSGTVLTVTVTSIAKGVKCYYISYTYESAGGGTPTVVTPTFDPIAGTYTTAQDVEINCETDGATIHYTMTEDGSTPADPTESDATYSSAISVTKSGTKIKAKAFKADMTASSVASATYNIKPNAPTITGGANVTITGDDGLTFYYTIDGSTPTNSSTEYTAPFTPGDCTVKAIAYDTNGNSSAVTTLKYKYMPLAPKNINSGYFEKVTDVSSLENGDAILIVNEGDNVALGPQSGNNCPGKAVIISAGAIGNKGDAQKLVLVKKTEKIEEVDTDVFYFYTGSAYLYAASSGSNYLKVEANPDDNNNARATIAISSGNATIKFTGTYTRNWLKYNSNNGSPLFSCYKSDDSSMKLVQIYKEVAHNESVTVTDAGYATLASDYALDFTDSDIKAYIATSSSGSAVTLSAVNKVPANTGILLKYSGGKTEPIPVFDGTSADDVSENLLVVSDGTDKGGTGIYALANKTHGVGFYPVSSELTIDSGKVYLDLSGSPVKEFLGFDFGDSPDAIETLFDSPLKGENIYNLAGQRVNKAQKGIYIVNGKKVLY